MTSTFKTLGALALHLVKNSTSTSYSLNYVDPRSELSISGLLSALWIQAFAERFRIISRAHTGKILTSPSKEAFIEKEVAYHLGQLCRDFERDVFRRMISKMLTRPIPYSITIKVGRWALLERTKSNMLT